MKKRYITIPEKVTVIDVNDPDDNPLKRENGEVIFITFNEFIRGRTIDPIFADEGIESIESSLSIRNGVKGKAPGDLWEIDEDDWTRLCKSIRTPKNPYVVAFASAIIPFKDAVCEAKSEKPTSHDD